MLRIRAIPPYKVYQLYDNLMYIS